MRLLTAVALLLVHGLYPALAIKIGRGLLRPFDSASSISSLRYRHTGYIDQKIRSNAYISLNHESYHLRNVVAAPAPSWSTSMGPSNISSDSIAIDESFHVPDTLPPNASTNASSSSSSSRLSNIPALLQSTEALATTSDPNITWDNQTDTACAAALSALSGVASNPSGMAACYNIRNFDSTSGIFMADLRLFRIAAPAVDWTRMVVSSEVLDVVYAGASITSRGSTSKRSLIRNSLTDLRKEAKDSYLRRNIMSHVDMTKTRLALPTMEQDEAKDLYRRRSSGTPPKMLQAFTFTVKISGQLSALHLDEVSVRSAFVPNITFSGATSDGTALSTQLPTSDAALVNGLFTQYSIMNTSARLSMENDEDWQLPGNTFAVFPVGFIITSVWTMLLLMVMGYGTLSKIQARDAYRRRVRSRMSGDIGRLYTSSELESLSTNVQAWM